MTRHASMQTGRVPIRAVLFDFDDTLAPSLHFWVASFQRVFAGFGVTLSHDQARTRCLSRDWDDVAADFAVCSTADLRRRMDEELPIAYERTTLFPGAREVLEQCGRDGIAIGLVTSSPGGVIRDVIERLGIAAHFGAVVCGDEVARKKPDPEPVMAALAALGATTTNAAMVGDSAADVGAGAAAGVTTVLRVPGDATPAHRGHLRGLGAHHEFADHIELAALLARLTR